MNRIMTHKTTTLLVESRAGMAVTTSLIIANRFGKKHQHVLETIRKVECSESFSRSNFRQSDYVDDRGKTQPMYVVTRDGFSFLAMGYTGKKAAAFKEQFINAFNRMESALLNKQNLSWQQARLEGKTVRRELTDTVCEFVEYATAQGSHNARLYYRNITTMTYKALSLVKETSSQPFRDMLDTMQNIFLAAEEYVARQALIDGMQQQLPYKDIYKLARDRVTATVATLPQQRMITI